MKKIFLLIAAMAVVGSVSAQEELSKQLEVTRAYTPRVGRAEKLPIAPDMTDTVRLRPRISYSITSTASATSFDTRPYEAATIDMAPFESGRPLYLRAGAGAPFATVLDLYFTPRMRAGSTFGIFANHKGAYSKIKNDIGIKAPATEMANTVGLWGSRKWKRYSLEGNITYDNRRFDMYGYPDNFINPLAGAFKQDRVGWNRIGGNIGFGDDFTDMSHFNFRIEFDGGYTRRAGEVRHMNQDVVLGSIVDEDGDGMDITFPQVDLPISYSQRITDGLYGTEIIIGDLSDIPGVFLNSKEPWQADVRGSVRMGLMFTDRQGFDAEIKIRYRVTSIEYFGSTNENPYYHKFGSVSTALRYIWAFEKFRLKVGGDLFYIHKGHFKQVIEGGILPAAEVSFDIADDRFIPFATLSSRILDGDLETLSRRNPYVFLDGATGLQTDLRGGVMGDFNDLFSYKLSVGASRLKDYNLMSPSLSNIRPMMFFPLATDGRQYTAGVELGLRAPGGFSAKLGGNWYKNKFDEFIGNRGMIGFTFVAVLEEIGTWLPDFDAGITVAWSYKDKFSLSAGVDVTGTRDYGIRLRRLPSDTSSGMVYYPELFSVSPVADVFASAEVKVAPDFWVWVEGRNLANQALYPYPYYRGRGASVMAGVKMVF